MFFSDPGITPIAMFGKYFAITPQSSVGENDSSFSQMFIA